MNEPHALPSRVADDDALVRRLRLVALLAPLAYATVAVIVQAVHPRFDWQLAPLSFYLSGPHGLWLQSVYALLALGMAGAGWICWRAHRPSRWQAAASLLMFAAAACLLLTALFPGGSPEHPVSPAEHALHGGVASGAFLFSGIAMLLQGVLDWRNTLRSTLPLALLAVGLLVVGHWPGVLPRGLGQKMAIAGYLAMLFWRARALPR